MKTDDLTCTGQCTKPSQSPARALTSLALVGLLAGCAVGPDFKRPEAPTTSKYTVATMPAQTALSTIPLGEVQTLRVGREVSSEWWHSLGSYRLDALIALALQNSPTLASAKSTLRQAQELHAAQAGSTRYPQVDASIGAQRQRMSSSGLGLAGEAREFSLYNTSVGVNYRLDLAGGNRRALEALAARVDYRSHELAGAQLTLAANITTTAIVRAKLAGQLAATKAMVEAQDEH